jgi:hypothetical protein
MPSIGGKGTDITIQIFIKDHKFIGKNVYLDINIIKLSSN